MTRYVESLLADGERIVVERRQHPIALLGRARWALLALLGALVLAFVASGFPAQGGAAVVRDLLGYVALALGLGGIGGSVWAYLAWANDLDVLTNRRVIQTQGVLNKSVADSSLEKINDAEMEQTWLGRLLGFGDLDVMTASEAGIERMRTLPDPRGFKRAMLNAKHEYELELARGGRVGPPLRATSGVPTSPPGAAAARGGESASVSEGRTDEAARRPAVMSPDEVTRTLAQLADLRDRGAITAEDYERKKQDLLDRL